MYIHLYAICEASLRACVMLFVHVYHLTAESQSTSSNIKHLTQTSDPSFTFKFPQIMQHVMKLSYCRIILLVHVICVVLPSSHKILLIKNKYFPLPPFRFCISVLSSTWAYAIFRDFSHDITNEK